MYAVIEAGGKQFKVELGSVIYTESLKVDESSEVNFKPLAKFDGKKLIFAGSISKDSLVTAKVLKNGKKKKLTVFKYKPKKNYKRKIGHRQCYTKLEITKLV